MAENDFRRSEVPLLFEVYSTVKADKHMNFTKPSTIVGKGRAQTMRRKRLVRIS